jgi:hypothetical protein
MSQLCYGWMKFKVESGSPTKTRKKQRSVCMNCLISVLVAVEMVRYSMSQPRLRDQRK